MLENITHTIRSIQERDPAARRAAEIFLLYPGFHALLLHRPAHFLYRHRCFFAARSLSQFSRFLTGIEIHPGAKIGKGLFIDHGSGVVIGETTVIGDHCTIYQGATLGGTGKESGKRHPTLGNHVMVGSGARILGPFKVGDYAKIAAGAVVLNEVPPHATAVGVPARVVRIGKEKISSASELDQVNLPNPVEAELEKLSQRIAKLERNCQRAQKKLQRRPISARQAQDRTTPPNH